MMNVISTGPTQYFTNLIRGDYPNYERFIESIYFHRKVEVHTDSLRNVLEQIEIMADNLDEKIYIKLEKDIMTIRVYLGDEDDEDYDIEDNPGNGFFTIDVKFDCEVVVIELLLRELIEPIRRITDEYLTLKFNYNTDLFMIEANFFQYYVFARKLSWFRNQ